MISDQKVLKFLIEQIKMHPQFRKWLMKLLIYDFEIIYHSGLQNKVVDELCRVSHPVELTFLSASSIMDVETVLEEVWKDGEL